MTAPTGVLISNLGTPEGPTPEQVSPYLKEFLLDPYVIDVPIWIRWPLVNWIIVPRRKFASSDLYKRIWTPAGSPLLVHTKALAAKMADVLKPEGFHVEMGMRYGRPSLREAMMNLKQAKVQDLIVTPQYPQYALSSYESTRQRVLEIARELRWAGRVVFVRPFFDAEEFLIPSAEIIRRHYDPSKHEHILMSFHGLPEGHVKKTESQKGHCLSAKTCCDVLGAPNANCYRAQSFWTARELARRLGLASRDYSVGFQSRLTRRWIRPFSDERLIELAKSGVKRLAVVCPSFTADCLETVEEVGIRYNEIFREAGGETVDLIPCLNSDELWVEGLSKLIRQAQTKELPGPRTSEAVSAFEKST